MTENKMIKTGSYPCIGFNFDTYQIQNDDGCTNALPFFRVVDVIKEITGKKDYLSGYNKANKVAQENKITGKVNGIGKGSVFVDAVGLMVILQTFKSERKEAFRNFTASLAGNAVNRSLMA